MKYKYTTATGRIEIEVDESYEQLLQSMDKEEYNSNRKHLRRQAISLDNTKYEGDWFEDKHDAISKRETSIDLARIMESLTELQRICFVETRINGKSQREVAVVLDKSRSTVQHAVEGAITIIKKFLL